MGIAGRRWRKFLHRIWGVPVKVWQSWAPAPPRADKGQSSFVFSWAHKFLPFDPELIPGYSWQPCGNKGWRTLQTHFSIFRWERSSAAQILVYFYLVTHHQAILSYVSRTCGYSRQIATTMPIIDGWEYSNNKKIQSIALGEFLNLRWMCKETCLF